MNSILNVAELTATETNIKAITDFQLNNILASEAAGTLTSPVTINSKVLGDTEKKKIVGASSPANLAIGTDGDNVGITAAISSTNIIILCVLIFFSHCRQLTSVF